MGSWCDNALGIFTLGKKNLVKCSTDYLNRIYLLSCGWGVLASHEVRKNALAAIVADRNDLIHHLLPKFDPNSMKSCLEWSLSGASMPVSLILCRALPESRMTSVSPSMMRTTRPVRVPAWARQCVNNRTSKRLKRMV